MRSAGGVERRKVDSFICQRHGGAYLRVSAESHITRLNMPQEGNQKWGASRVHKSRVNSLPQMLQEAWYALWAGFSYSGSEKVGEIQFYLCKNMNEEFSLKSVAEKYHFSEPYFCTLFKKGTGMSVTILFNMCAFIMELISFETVKKSFKKSRKR